MEIEIVNERGNPLLDRREIRFKVSYEGATPRFMDVRGKLISVLKSDGELTVVDNIKTEYGRHVAVGYAKIYANKEGIAVEPKHRIKKNLEKKEETAKENPSGVEPEAGGAGE